MLNWLENFQTYTEKRRSYYLRLVSADLKILHPLSLIVPCALFARAFNCWCVKINKTHLGGSM